MPLDFFIWVGFTALLGSYVSTLAGFGSGFLFIATLTFFFPLKVAIAVSSFFFLILNISKCWIFRTTVDWQFIRTALVFVFFGLILGILLFQYIPSRPIAIFNGLLGIYIACEHFFSWKKINFSRSLSSIRFMGGMWGLFSGLGNGVIARVQMLQLGNFDRFYFSGTSAYFCLLADTMKIGGYILTGTMNWDHILLLAPCSSFFLLHHRRLVWENDAAFCFSKNI